MSSLVLSVLLSLVSAVAYAAGAIVQERVASGGDGRSYAPLRNAAWWAAVGLNGTGALLHVVALAYGPLSLVQPLGALTIVFALPMAALFVGRAAGRTAWRGAVMATVGLAGLLALTGSSESHALGGADQLLLATATFGAVAALFLAGQGLGRVSQGAPSAAGRAGLSAHAPGAQRAMMRSVVLATGAGVAFGMASVFTKTVAVEWTSGALGEGLPSLLVIAVFAAAGLLLSQAAYRGAGLTAPLATVTVVNPVVAAVVGLTLFGEHFRFGLVGTLLALASGVLAAAGLVLLTTQRLAAERQEGPPSRGAGGEGRGAGRPPRPRKGGRGPVTLPGPAEEPEPPAGPGGAERSRAGSPEVGGPASAAPGPGIRP
ncbi:DMT family transporter [Streptomyces sp. NPDC060198]|uniref:DMT family transporter n=1 Tax=Streptomyces sp. NPDC060198 TaxID=3347070 RepID=UPI0036690E03